MEIMHIRISDWRQFGCPFCGYRKGINCKFSDDGTEVTCDCGHCHKGFAILNDEATHSTHNYGTADEPRFIPISVHPRVGTPCNGKVYKRTETAPATFVLVADGAADDTHTVRDYYRLPNANLGRIEESERGKKHSAKDNN